MPLDLFYFFFLGQNTIGQLFCTLPGSRPTLRVRTSAALLILVYSSDSELRHLGLACGGSYSATSTIPYAMLPRFGPSLAVAIYMCSFYKESPRYLHNTRGENDDVYSTPNTRVSLHYFMQLSGTRTTCWETLLLQMLPAAHMH